MSLFESHNTKNEVTAEITTQNLQNEPADTKQYLINTENFNLLKQYQRQIFEATEVTPSLRKILNELITIDNLEQVKATLVNTFTT